MFILIHLDAYLYETINIAHRVLAIETYEKSEQISVDGELPFSTEWDDLSYSKISFRYNYIIKAFLLLPLLSLPCNVCSIIKEWLRRCFFDFLYRQFPKSHLKHCSLLI